MEGKRGSERLLLAWRHRALTEESVHEIAAELGKSPAKVEKVKVTGGPHSAGVSVLLSYKGDDVPWCGNDLAFWLRWRRKFGAGVVRPPKISINGIPVPDIVRVQLDFGHFDDITNPATDLINEDRGRRRASTARPTGGAPVLQVHPTRHCNLACAHCYTSSGPKVRVALALDTLTACIDDAVALGYRQLAVSGGEPLLYPALRELLQHARARGMVTTITTNGVLATADRWSTISDLVDVVAVSIDGRRDEHDAIRRSAGAFARTVANLSVLRDSGVTFGLIFTLTQYNVDSLEFVVRLAAEHGAKSVQVHPLTLHGRAARDMPTARPDALELIAALGEADRLGASLGVAVHVDAVSVEQLFEHRMRLVPRRSISALVDVAPTVIVDSDGTVMPLTHELDRSFALGSIHERSLSSLATDWLASGRADALAEVCDTTWRELSTAGQPAFYWYDEVALRSQAERRPVHARPESTIAGRRLYALRIADTREPDKGSPR
jgi:MoaA/NifB/PqqE/SkfB family radical SAM enzyme